MKHFILTTSLFLITLIANAQNSIKGTVINTAKTPVDFAEIYLLDRNGKLIQQTFSNEKGEFNLDNVENNAYLFQIHSFGIQYLEKTIEVTTPVDLGEIIIDTNNNLDEIIVKTQAKVFERKVDRTVFNIENSVHATNNNVTDLLKLTPGVKVDDQSIDLIGKGAVRVMIDDKIVHLSGEQLLNYLKTIPSDNIKKIEVITAPPAKYEAEGQSGLINIVLKEPKQDAWSNQISTGLMASQKAIWRIGDVFNYNKNKVSINAGINGTIGYAAGKDKSILSYPTQTWYSTNNSNSNNGSISGNFLIDYKASNKTSFGVQYRGGKNTPSEDDYTTTLVNNPVDNLIKTITTDGKTKNITNNHSVNAHLTQKFDTLGTKLNLDFDYFSFNNDKSRLFNTNEYSVDNFVNKAIIAESTGEQNIDNYSVKVDVEQPFKDFKLSYGAKASFTTTKNKTNFFDLTSGSPIQDDKQKDNFEYKENTQALYVSGNKSFGEKWQAQAGLRLESTQTEGFSKIYNTTDKNDYTKLFPSLYVSYEMNDDNIFSVNYSRRIMRPSFWQLNPFRWYVNEYSFVEGNPKLQPIFSNSVELTHTFKGKLITSLRYAKSKDSFSQYPLADPETNTQMYLNDNIFDMYSFNGSITYAFNTLPWLQSQNSFSAFHNKTKLIKDLDFETLNGWGTHFSTNNTITLNTEKTLQAQVDYWIQPKFNVLMYNLSTMSSLNLGLKYAMVNKKLNMSLYVNDILRRSAQVAVTETNGVRQTYKANTLTRYVNVGLSYSFGNSKIRVTEHQGGNKDEINRK